MKHLYFLFALLSGLITQTYAQDFRWAKQIGGSAGEYITGKTFDKMQRLICVGNATGVVDLDPGPAVFTVNGSVSSGKSFVTQMDTAGTVLWIDTFGGTGYIYTESVTTDNGNAIYITGNFRGTVDFDPGPGQQLRTSTSNTGSIFFLKLNTNGALQWVNVLSGTAQNINQGYDIIVSKENGILVSGTFGTGNIDFDPGPGTYLLTAPVRHIFVAKYNLDGGLLWAKSYGGDGPEESCRMETDYEGNIYLTGQFSSNCDFDPGPAVEMPYPNSQEKLYVLKWDKDGNYQWVRCFTGTGGSSYSNDIDYDNNGNLYVCGGFSGTMNFNDGGDGGIMTSSPYLSTFVVKLDTAGTYKWSFSADYGTANSGYVDKLSNYYITGYYHNTAVDFDPGPGVYTMPSAGNVQTYICKYDSSKHLLWGRALQSTMVSRGTTIELDSTGMIYVSGEFNQTADFNPAAPVYNLTSNGADDIYLLKLFQCYLDPGITLQNQTLTALGTGVSYQWINCASGQNISGATSASYTPAQTGDYAVIITSGNGCKDTSDCYHVTISTNSIAEQQLAARVQLYPNPGYGTYNVVLPQQYAGATITVYDVLGREVMVQALDDQQTTVSLDTASGVYMLRIRLKDGMEVHKKLIHNKL